jgi:hypothetical protein
MGVNPYDNVPPELKAYANWVCGRADKAPVNPMTGRLAMADVPTTWATFDEAVRYRDANGKNGIRTIGFEVSETPFTGIDLDHCRNADSGEIEPWALEIIETVDTYTEISPSGTGIRMFVTCNLPPTNRKSKNIEIANNGKYFSVTGNHIEGTATHVGCRPEEIRSIFEKYFKPKPELLREKPTVGLSMSDEHLLKKAFGAENGAKLRLLWEGNTNAYPSSSEADQALCNMLAFWTGNDASRIDSLFRQSGLMREKWDRDDYRARTIAKAIDATPETYRERINEPAIPSHDEQPSSKGFDAAILESREFRRLELPARKRYLHPLIQEQQITLYTGPRGLGKTWLGMGIADAVTRCKDFGPWEAIEAAPCLYLDGEMATVDTQNRDIFLNPRNEREAPLYIYSDAYANSLGLPRANLLDPQWRERMGAMLSDRNIKLFVIDNLASLAGGIDENAKKDWDPVNEWLIELRFRGISTLMLHHTNKEGGQRGTSAREDNVDLSILLKKPSNYQIESGADFIVTFTKTRLPLEDLKFAQDYRFTLTQDEDGNATWLWTTARAETKQLVLDMLNEGVSAKDVASALTISAGQGLDGCGHETRLEDHLSTGEVLIRSRQSPPQRVRSDN